jgi:hypothetical protein
MYNIQKNLFKKSEVFKCVHDVHQQFKSQMSPFHILVEKQCYPDGCIYFQWKCKLLAKKKKCFRNFTQVGKECSNCKYFFEEKIHQYPEFISGNENGAKFLDNFKLFEEWVDELKKKRVSCEGDVSEVKPDFIIFITDRKIRLSLRGFLICFDDGFIDNQAFEDKFYLSISAVTQNQLLIREGDQLEFQANLFLDRGRFKFTKSGRFNFYQRGNSVPHRITDFLVPLKTYTIQSGQPRKCLNCKFGILADVVRDRPGPRRAVMCMQGIQDYKTCAIAFFHSISDNSDKCANTKWGKPSCNRIL